LEEALRPARATRSGQAHLGILALTIFLDLLGFGIIIPLMPQYALSYGATDIEVGLLMSSYSLMQFLFVPVWGRISDRIGRRPILLVSIGSSVVSFLLLGMAGSLAALFLARILAGISTANFSVAQAYVADVTRPEERARGMGLVGAAFGLGFVVGPFVGGELSPVSLSLPLGLTLRQGTVPFFFAAVLSAANWILAFRFVPESLGRGVARSRTFPGFFSARRLVAALRHPRFGSLFTLFFVVTFAMSMMEATLILFGQARFDMTPREAGRLLGFVGILMVVVQGGLVGRLARRFGERKLLLAGTILMAPGLLLIAPASSLVPLAAAMIPLAVGSGISQPSLNAILSRGSGHDEQGGVLGINQSLGSLARVLGPWIGTTLLQKVGLTAPYLAGGAVMALAAALAVAAVGPLSEPGGPARQT
jgi:DHA1 family tetracycline resistance protein-like MFS transporter